MQIDEQPRPESGTVHVWNVSLDNLQLDLPEILSDQELSRYAAISHPLTRMYFLRTRSALRTILASYVGLAAKLLSFVNGENGKPGLAGETPTLHFNLSHSGNRLLLSITADAEVGVDVEQISARRDYAALAQRFFTPQESRLIESDSSDSLFYKMWVLKEAAVKARGMKLLAGLDRFECLLAENGEIEIRDKLKPLTDQAWSVRQWQLSENFTAAVIVKQAAAVFVDRTLPDTPSETLSDKG